MRGFRHQKLWFWSKKLLRVKTACRLSKSFCLLLLQCRATGVKICTKALYLCLFNSGRSPYVKIPVQRMLCMCNRQTLFWSQQSKTMGELLEQSVSSPKGHGKIEFYIRYRSPPAWGWKRAIMLSIAHHGLHMDALISWLVSHLSACRPTLLSTTLAWS